MSPEQVRGKPVDKPAHIWAFGCVLFEMLTGRRAFPGETPYDTSRRARIAARLESPAGVNARCRASCPSPLPGKGPGRRFHDIADVRIEIEEAVRLRPLPGDWSLWVEDLERGTRVRMVGDGGFLPVWSPRGDKLGRWLLANVFSSEDVVAWMLSTTGESPRPLLAAPFVERDARLSPDGALVAYVSEDSGRPEVSIQTVDRPPRREVVSVSGGDQPVWSRDATELFFVDPAGFLRAVRATSDREGRPALDTPPC